MATVLQKISSSKLGSNLGITKITETIDIATRSKERRRILINRAANALLYEQVDTLGYYGNEILTSPISTTIANILGTLGVKGVGHTTRITKKVRKAAISAINASPSGSVYKIITATNHPLSEITLHNTISSRGKEVNTLEAKPYKNFKSREDIFGRPSEDAGFYIVNRSVTPYEYLKLQNRPNSIQVENETSWAVIKSNGRNLPFYHYTGAEDSFTMSISWYANPNKASRDNIDVYQEVLCKCKLLEAWSKADGYAKAPPILELIFGDVEYNPFKDQVFILYSAKYNLNNIQYYRGLDKSDYTDHTYLLHLDSSPSTKNVVYPATATQELVFKRISDHNLTREEIITGRQKIIAGIQEPPETLALEFDNEAQNPPFINLSSS